MAWRRRAPHAGALYHRLSPYYDRVFSPFVAARVRSTIASLEIPPEAKVLEVGIGTGGIGVVSRLQLAYHGINFKKDIKPFFPATGELATLLKDGKVDVSFLTDGLAKMVTATHEIKMISWQEADRKAYIDKNPYFGKFTYRPNHFKGVGYQVETVDNGIQLVTHADTPDDLVYKLAKTIIENLDCAGKIFAPAKALSPEWCASKLGNPFHPGSIRYFKDAGLMK